MVHHSENVKLSILERTGCLYVVTTAGGRCRRTFTKLLDFSTMSRELHWVHRTAKVRPNGTDHQ